MIVLTYFSVNLWMFSKKKRAQYFLFDIKKLYEWKMNFMTQWDYIYLKHISYVPKKWICIAYSAFINANTISLVSIERFLN